MHTHISNIFMPSLALTFETSRKFVTAQERDNVLSLNSNLNLLAKQETGVLCLSTNSLFQVQWEKPGDL